jgi:broad specificity phosphatase PhoE
MWRTFGKVSSWQSVFTSPYTRCAAIANELGDRAHLPVTELPELAALDWGAWTGKDKEEVMRVDREALTRFDTDPFTHRATSGESLIDMTTRSIQACRTILQQTVGQHALVISHKWNIQAIIAYALQMPQRSLHSIVCDYGSLTRLEFTETGGRYLVGLVFHAPRMEDMMDVSKRPVGGPADPD